MSRVRAPRAGTELRIKQRPLTYSRHPVARTARRYGLQTRIFATNPWSVIRRAVNDIPAASTKDQARAFVEQAEDFYRAYQSAHEVASKPLLVYYAMMNLAKAFVLFKGVQIEYRKAQHGLQESVHPGGQEFTNSFLKAFKSRPSNVNVFDDFRSAITGSQTGGRDQVYELSHLHPQILQGHRLWAAANDSQERFVEIQRVEFLHDASSRMIWLNLRVFADDLTRFGISRKKLIEQGGLASRFRNVRCSDRMHGRLLLKFEQTAPVTYTGRPSDNVQQLVDLIRDDIWSAVLRAPPYRKHYLYLSPSQERRARLPQILSAYVFIYYLGSVTRYRPNYFSSLVADSYGAHLEELISNVPNQFLFLLASEFAGREVAHAPIV